MLKLKKNYLTICLKIVAILIQSETAKAIRLFLVKNKIIFTVIRTRLQSSHFSHYNFQEHSRGGPPIVLGVSISLTYKINFSLSFGHILDKVFLWGNLAMDLGENGTPELRESVTFLLNER